MATVQVFTKARMFAIEQAAFIAARLESYNLILTRKNGEDVNLGNVRGAQGSAGTNGTNGSNGLTPTLRGTSTTSQAITVGSKTFAVSGLNVAFPIGATVKIQAALSQNYMVGLVTASTTTSVTVNVLEINGSGTFSSWTLMIGAFSGTVSDSSVNALLNGSGPLTVASLKTMILERVIPLGQLVSPPGVPQTVTSGSWQKHTNWGAEPLGRLGGITYDAPEFTIQTPGVYELTASARWLSTSSTNTRRGLTYYVKNVLQEQEALLVPSNANGFGMAAPTIQYRLAVGDTGALAVHQDSPAPLGIDRVVFTVKYICP